MGFKTVPPFSCSSLAERQRYTQETGQGSIMSSSKRKRADIDLERRDDDVDDGSGDHQPGEAAPRVQKEGQIKEGEAQAKEVVEVVVDRGGDGSKEEIKCGTQQGGVMEEDKQSPAASAGNDGADGIDDEESGGGGTRAEEEHMVEAAPGDGDGDHDHTAMAQDEVYAYMVQQVANLHIFYLLINLHISIFVSPVEHDAGGDGEDEGGEQDAPASGGPDGARLLRAADQAGRLPEATGRSGA